MQILFNLEVGDLGCDLYRKVLGFESRDGADARPAFAKRRPELIDPDSNRGNRSDAGYGYAATFRH
jgi:hypothetical protein